MVEMRRSRAELFRIADVIPDPIEDSMRQDCTIVDVCDTFYHIEQSP
jgi:hypothetical protein